MNIFTEIKGLNYNKYSLLIVIGVSQPVKKALS